MLRNAILGIDTLWGGDVMCASGTGRFIADSWFSDEPLPAAYTHPGGDASARERRRFRQESSIAQQSTRICARWIFPRAIAGIRRRSSDRIGGCAGEYLVRPGLCFEAMWDLAMEILGKGAPVPL